MSHRLVVERILPLKQVGLLFKIPVLLPHENSKTKLDEVTRLRAWPENVAENDFDEVSGREQMHPREILDCKCLNRKLSLYQQMFPVSGKGMYN